MAVDWDDLRYVLALDRAGSLGAAARSLKVEQSTASRRLTALETELGVQLVIRSPTGVSLTEAGVAAARLAESVEHGIDELVRRIGNEDRRPEGVVKLATTDTTAAFLMAGLVPLREAYPKLHIELVVSNSANDLLRHEADVALRLFRETAPTLIARKVGDIGWSLYASSSYVDRTGLELPLAEPLDLAAQEVIGFSESLARAPGAVWLAEHVHSDNVVLRASSIAAIVNAAKAGAGIAVVPCFSVAADPALVRLTPSVVTFTEAFLVIPPDHRDTVRVRIVMDAVAALFDQERVSVSGAG